MTDPKSSTISRATLNDGTTAQINDHVYLAPEHLGEPFYIGRIMEFTNSTKRRGLQARIAWYNRPKDVVNRKVYDPCLLIATMHSDLNPVSSIRGKCRVMHKDYIDKSELETYRSQPDSFYYNQLYDRYIQRVYDVVPCEAVQNVPTDIQEALMARYQFIVVEQGKASELTDTRRVCCVCHDWCASADSVKCSSCQNNYHMGCVNPPLSRKPSKGFAWQCAVCFKKDPLNAAKSSPTLHKEKQQPNSPAVSSSRSPSNSDKTESSAAQSAKSNTSNRIRPIQTRTTRSQTESRTGTPSQPTSPTTSTMKGVTTNGAKAGINKKNIITMARRRDPNKMHTTHMWPFRYFGIHTNVKDILDADDRIYPRARSRLGPKYQAIVADWDPETESEIVDSSQARNPSDEAALSRTLSKQGFRGRRKRARVGDRKDASSSPAPPGSELKSELFDRQDEFDQLDAAITRGGPDTVIPMFDRPATFTDEQVDRYMKKVCALPDLPLPSHSADFLDRALIELQQYDFDEEKALESVRCLIKDDFDYQEEWTHEDIAAFEEGIKAYGHELHSVATKVPDRSMAQIVRFFYKWKKTERYEPVYSEWTKIYKPNKKFRRRGLSVQDSISADTSSVELSESESEDEDSKEDPTIVSVKGSIGYECMNCGTDESDVWRRAPGDTDKRRKLHRFVLCDKCGVYWLKYGTMRQVSDSLASRRGRGRPANAALDPAASKTLGKRKRLMEASSRRKIWGDGRKRVKTPTPPPPSDCAVCGQMPPDDKLLTCKECGLSVHSDCYGSDIPANVEKWMCDTCLNTKSPTVSITYRCVLCSESREVPRQALKKTSGYNWGHVICTAFIPHVEFASTSLLSPVECINRIPIEKWQHTCNICHIKTGACIKCAECQKPVHVRCAQTSNFHIGFETFPVESADVKSIKPGVFKNQDDQVELVPSVWCAEHDISNKRIIGLDERDVHGKASLMVYAETYKQCEATGTGAMRKSRLISSATGITDGSSSPLQDDVNGKEKHSPDMDAIRNVLRTANSRKSSAQKPTPTEAPKHQCIVCGVKASPIWWSARDRDEKIHGKPAVNEVENEVKLEDGEVTMDQESILDQQKLCHRCYFVL
ncbi:hypothetical protein INT43_001104 [Umbelopsis isabellina]|uniref:Uncharacterized protein n=1 Tax=Mortierella isabellina TaxID=91625 RepID=A0A8H7PK22_MORIS|nr:hypothetical protein INT43_001104 [Umbelopsis isabellina]